MVRPARGRHVRLLSGVLYFAVAYAILYSYADNYFCSPARGQPRAVVAAKLALACTVWDALAGAISVFLNQQPRWLRACVSALIAGLGFASIPFWIYRGYGHFMFEHTWADVSCVFAEGYGMVFPLTAAPVLAVVSVTREWLTLKCEPVPS
jgi:hypothetical protein